MPIDSKTLVHAPTPAAVPQRLRMLFDRLLAPWRRALRIRAQRAALERLDAATLRDLGLHRSEIGSLQAEMEGDHFATRRRVGADAELWPAARWTARHIDRDL
jgi:uncharacterized protein YjiS (DUF1127 family)